MPVRSIPFNVTYANVSFLEDTSKVIRLQSQDRGEDLLLKEQLAPLKHQPLGDLVDELDRLIPFRYQQDFGLPPNYPGRNLGAMAYQSQTGPMPNPIIKIGDWYYPPSASRWSVFRGLASSSQVAAMIAATNANIPATFQMQIPHVGPNNPSGDATFYSPTSQMYLLPPRPLAEHGGQFDGLYLITLVDERYWFQFNPISLRIDQNSTWTSLINQIANALNITLAFNPVPTAYSQPEPDSQLWTNFENAGLLLDALAYNIGRTVVRNLNGSYSLFSALDSQATVTANRGNAQTVIRTAGGDIFNSGTQNLRVGDLTPVRNAALPANVLVTFPKYVQGDDPVPHFVNARYKNQRPSAWYEESYGDVFSVNVPLASGDPVGMLSGLTGI